MGGDRRAEDPGRSPAGLIPHSRPMVGAAEAAAAAEAVASGMLAEGARTAAFEQALARRLGLSSAVAASSGTAALHLALSALGIGPGDEVIVPSFVCAALLHAVARCGATAVPADIDPVTLNLDPADARRRMSRRTRAVVAPHMFGLAADVEGLLALGVPVVEDCAQALGGTSRGRPLGALGAASVFSFYATKVITTGEGGMVASRSEELLDRVRQLKRYDGVDDPAPRFNYKLTEMQAAIGVVQLGRLQAFIDRRRGIAARYTAAFGVHPVGLPPVDPEHIFFRYVVDLRSDAERFLREARAAGVACERPVYRPLHRLLGRQGYPASETAFRQCVSIPIYPALMDTEIDRIIAVVSGLLPHPAR